MILRMNKMTATFQDDDRENRMIELFNLYKDGDEGRSGVDAFLDCNGQRVPFELKTTSDRAEYLIKRGSTLNNPHIPLSYFAGWFEITENHAEHLRRMVKNYFDSV